MLSISFEIMCEDIKAAYDKQDFDGIINIVKKNHESMANSMKSEKEMADRYIMQNVSLRKALKELANLL